MTHKVFISYQTDDLCLVEWVKQQLQDNGMLFFVAEYCLPAGARLSERILTNLERCDTFVLLWSKSARESIWVDWEINQAIRMNKHIVPIMLEPGLEPHPALSDIKYLSLEREPEIGVARMKYDMIKRSTENSDGAEVLLGVGLVVLLAAIANQ